MRRVVLAILVALASGGADAVAAELPQFEKVGFAGLEIGVIDKANPLNRVHVARVAASASVELKVLPAASEKGLEMPSQICRRYGGECLAAINGDMFDRRTRRPLGGMVTDGVVTHPAKPSYRQLNLMVANRVVLTDDGNIPAGTRQSVGTSYAILLDGNVMPIQEDTSFVWGAEARTLVGWNDKGDLFLVTVDQGKRYSRGMSLGQAAELMRELGATNAVNLDGGESTTFVMRGEVLNRPWSGEQAVANILAVVPRAAQQPQITIGHEVSLGVVSGGGGAAESSLRYQAVALVLVVGMAQICTAIWLRGPRARTRVAAFSSSG